MPQDDPGVEALLDRARELLSEEASLGIANGLVNQALTLRPDSVTAWVVKCQIASAQGDDWAALAAIEVAARRAPPRAETLYWRGAVLGDVGRYADAVRALDRALAAVTADDLWLLEDLYYEKAVVLEAQGQGRSALATLREGLEECPGSSLLRLAIGGARTARLRWMEADASPPPKPPLPPRGRPALKVLRGGVS